MAFVFEELDEMTRQFMLREFEVEEAGRPYRGKVLSDAGLETFPDLMRAAIKDGNEATLIAALSNPAYWLAMETYIRSGVPRERKVNADQAAERLAQTEFNTWYVRGLSARLMSEGTAECEVYRAAEPKWEVGACASHEGQTLPVEEVYAAHRAAYWPEPGDPTALTIPFGPGCHHTIRRVA